MHDPDKYDKYSEFQRRDAKEFIPYIISKMARKSFETVLDFGCGSGFNTRNILFPSLSAKLNNGPTPKVRVYGVDVSEEMVEFACLKYTHPQITYHLADVINEDAEFRRKFDKIFSFHVLHWIADQEKAMRRLYNLLKANGDIAFYYISNAAVFSVYDMMSRDSFWASYLCDVAQFIPVSYYSTNPAKDMRELMTSIGFDVKEASNFTRKFSFENVDSMIDAAMAANPFIHRIPNDLLDAYKKDFRKCFLALLDCSPKRDSPHTVDVDYSLVLIRAQKH